MTYTDLFRLSLILAPIIFLSGSFYIARHWRIGRQASISQHGGQSKPTLLLFVSLLFICGSFYYLAWWFWLQPKYHLPYFELIFIGATICLIITGLAPSHSPKPHLAKVHRIGAAGLIGAMYLLALLLTFSTVTIYPYIRIGFWLFLIYGPLILLATWRKPQLHQAKFWIEAGYIILFCIPVASLAI